jgi:ssDNA-binding Zn-finger/Zn-ribbon topoisomerase 1
VREKSEFIYKEELIRVIDLLPKIDKCDIEIKDIEIKDIECDACDGDGEVDFEFSYNGKDWEISETCPICEGIGRIQGESKIPTGIMIPDYSKCLTLNNKHFKGEYIKRLLVVAEILNEDKIFITFFNKSQYMFCFMIGNVEILVMPVVPFRDDENEICGVIKSNVLACLDVIK